MALAQVDLGYHDANIFQKANFMELLSTIVSTITWADIAIAGTISGIAFFLMRPLFRQQPSSHLEISNLRFGLFQKIY